jgi:hypothetical protein
MLFQGYLLIRLNLKLFNLEARKPKAGFLERFVVLYFIVEQS